MASQDPYFEQVPASRLYRTFGKKTQKRWKAIPPGLSDNDAKVLTNVKRRAYRLDYSLFSLCGIRFGWGSVIALIPVIGDGADAVLALMVIGTCQQIDGGLPHSLRMWMLMNIVIDFVVGLVPFAGDLIDAIYKCNTRNAVLLEKHLREKGAKALSSQGIQPSQVTDLSRGEEFDKYEHGITNNSSPSDEQQAPSSGRRADSRSGDQNSSNPKTAKHPQRNRSEKGWFGGLKNRAEDLEQGRA